MNNNTTNRRFLQLSDGTLINLDFVLKIKPTGKISETTELPIYECIIINPNGLTIKIAEISDEYYNLLKSGIVVEE